MEECRCIGFKKTIKTLDLNLYKSDILRYKLGVIFAKLMGAEKSFIAKKVYKPNKEGTCIQFILCTNKTELLEYRNSIFKEIENLNEYLEKKIKLSEMKFITLGIESIDKNKFKEITNNVAKPLGGLWSSPLKEGKYLSEWHEFSETFSFKKSDIGVIFKIKEQAKIYIIDSYLDLKKLCEKYPYDKTLTRLDRLDFEKMKKDFDGIFLTKKGESETRFSDPSFYGWDVESLLLFSLDYIEILGYIK